MKRSVPAFLRNQLSVLGFLEENKSVTRVRFGAQELGTWESLHPQCWCAGKKIHLRLSVLGRRNAYLLRAVRPIIGGVKLHLFRLSHPAPNCIEIRWMWNAADDSLSKVDVRFLLESWIKSKFSGSQIICCVQRSDLAKSLSCSFARAHFRHRGKNFLALASDTGDSGGNYCNGLTQALIWLGQLQKNKLFEKEVPRIHMLIPSGCSALLRYRILHLNPERVNVQVWECEKNTSQSWTAKRAPPPLVPREYRDYRWPALGPFHWSPLLLRVLELAPGLIRRYPRFQEYDSLKLSGLEFGQAFGSNRERVCFGVGPQKEELTDENFPDLTALVEEILFYRRADSPNHFHPYYRAQSERWLESLILDGASDLFPELAPESIYSQIPVYLGNNSGRVDILGADEQGSLIVMELKICPDPDLPLQALDYWIRVLQHNRNGDFERRGYFSGIRLLRSYPKIYLIAPIFSYHDTTEQILRFVDPKIEIWKISVNEDWRCGVKILRRMRVN